MNVKQIIKDFWPSIVGILALVVLSCYLYSVREVLPDNSPGAQSVREKLEGAEQHNQTATEHIERAERLSEDGKVRLGGAAVCADKLQEGAERAEVLIGECQQVLRAVRSRGEKEAAKN